MVKKSIENNIIIWKLTLNTNDKLHDVAEFEFFQENNRIWLNNCSVDEDLRKKGIGEYMIIEAIKEFGEIYFSNAEKVEHKRKNIENDSRYIEPPDGDYFVKSLLKKGIIKKEWLINPFELNN